MPHPPQPRRLRHRAPRCAAADDGIKVDAPWSCEYTAYGCSVTTAANYNATLAASSLFVAMNSMCAFAGCNDTSAANYDATVRAIQRTK